ncbi:AAA domain-containing protein [uncultured Erythrobacter sp.]|uniref:AAA domain-containing protein n=1 Tax=uncultured Erythrobacter sp. TaxID=263913 RepID=UPI00260C65EA|nr:AAA domain-containing protein [uncultured Erythrobacter sp.]
MSQEENLAPASPDNAPAARAPRPLAKAMEDYSGRIPENDLVHMFVPLMRQLAALHADGRVADINSESVVENSDGTLALARPEGFPIIANDAALRAVEPHAVSSLNIVGNLEVTKDNTKGTSLRDQSVATEGQEIDRPLYVAGYHVWEKLLGHHDERTDIFALGQLLAALSCDLDFESESDLADFATWRTNLFRLNPHLHPVVASLIENMTPLNRRDRLSDMGAIAHRLENYREDSLTLDPERVLDGVSSIPDRRTAVLSHLRDRLFDLSRRNKLIHFRPTQASVNLTVASVPLVMRLESIREDQLCTWNSRFAKDVLSTKAQPLGRWLRFEDQTYLPSSLDRILQQSRRDRAEYGFSNLRLVVAFLNWTNLKDAPNDKINSPLLWLPVEVTKKKGVRDRYTFRALDTEAEFNPALRHFLKQLYDIDLPATIDLSETTIEQVHADLMAQIHASEPGVTLDLTKAPSIRLIHEKAVQRLRQYEKRRGKSQRRTIGRPDFSYDRDNYRPLGRALFERHVVIKPLPQRATLGLPMPAPRPDFMSGAGIKETEKYSLEKEDKGKFAWEIDCAQVTLAHFNYRKMSLVRDYSALIEKADDQESFDRLFAIAPRDVDTQAPEPLTPGEQWNVVASDATQDAAVAMARDGASFIIQGPPGTGKSQTITNLIADFAARGKRVLFVCEKRAALDVVFNRLKQAGLERLATLIHDSQEDKKPFIQDLNQCYDDWVKNESRLEQLTATRDRTVRALAHNFRQIDEFETALGSVGSDEAISIRALIHRQIELPPIEGEYPFSVRERLPTPDEWEAAKPLSIKIEQVMRQSFGLASLSQMPFALLSQSTAQDERAYARTEEFINRAEPLADRLNEQLERLPDYLRSDDVSLADLHAIAETCAAAKETGLAANLDLLDENSAGSTRLAQFQATYRTLERKHSEASEAASHWHDPFDPDDAASGLALAETKEPGFFKFLSGQWRSLKASVEARYDFAAHAVKPTVTDALSRLAAMHQAAAEMRSSEAEIGEAFGTEEPGRMLKLRDAIAAQMREDARAERLFDPARAIPSDIANTATMLPDLIALRERTGETLDEAERLPLSELAEAIRDMREALEDLPDILPLLASTHAAEKASGFVLRNVAESAAGMEALVVDEALQAAFRTRPELQHFDAAQLGQLARRSAKARSILAEDNANMILATAHNKLLANVRRSTLSTAQLDKEGKAFKKAYATGRREAEHEFGKTMRYRSIRDMASGDTGMVVGDLKPIWLMSPLSVSDTLPLAPDLFDVVIFDEASQIPVEDGIPALCRAPQLIVVGDEMQLPPTSFFASSIDDEDMEIEVEHEGEAVNIMLDADSLLTQSARHLPATLLAWHYRSRSEALISFSNAAFYDGQLVTIPDQRLPISGAAPSALASEADEAANLAVERLLERPISVHPVADGVYAERANQPEAKLIAGMVCELLTKGDGKSIGIVAFSEAQQRCIENALEQLASSDREFGARMELEYNREDDGEFNGLFVKNLENVQGDERDIIILSICYAPNAKGKMAMNFGPINQRGGEKRLNVIFSRARHHMAVVTTIEPEAITNTHNDGAMALRTFLAFARARAEGDVETGRSALASINPGVRTIFASAPPHDPLRNAIAQELRLRGHEVEEYVGGASFRCDLAIKSEDGTGYALAILLDGELKGESREVYERYVFKPTILRGFGWRVIDIPSHTWRQDKDQVIALIESELRRHGVALDDDDPFVDIPAPAQVSVPKTRPPEAKSNEVAPPTSDGDDWQSFHFKRGTSDKFWRIAMRGTDVVVNYGRRGTKGQSVTKSYEDEARAKREMTKLILEKTRKGYIED